MKPKQMPVPKVRRKRESRGDDIRNWPTRSGEGPGPVVGSLETGEVERVVDQSVFKRRAA